jgi:hypothetical protein
VAPLVVMYSSMWAVSWSISAESMNSSSGTTHARSPYSRSSLPMFLFSLCARVVASVLNVPRVACRRYLRSW